MICARIPSNKITDIVDSNVHACSRRHGNFTLFLRNDIIDNGNSVTRKLGRPEGFIGERK